MKGWRQGPEAQEAVWPGIHQAVKGQQTAQALPGEDAAIVGQITGRHNIQPVHLLPEPI